MKLNPLNKRIISDLKIRKESLRYELKLTQDELDGMEYSVNHPEPSSAPDVSVIPGMVRPQWITRKDQLRDRITNLKVKIHELDLRIAEYPNQ